MHFGKSGFTKRPAEDPEAVVEGSSGNNRLAGADFIEQGGDGQGIGNDDKPLGEECLGHGIGRGAAVDHDRHAVLDQLGDAFGDAVLFLGEGVVLGDEVIAAALVINDQAGAAVVPVDDSGAFKVVQGAPDGRQAGLELARQDVKIGVLVLPDVGFDQVEPLLVGDAHFW